MLKNKKLGFLGLGNMGSALVRGLLKAKIPSSHIRASDLDVKKRDAIQKEFQVMTGDNNEAVTIWADIIILAVKPAHLPGLLEDISKHLNEDKLLISIAAGVTTQNIISMLNSEVKIVRAMPNTPVDVQSGAIALCMGKTSTQKDMKIAEELFKTVGVTIEIEEHLMDAVTGLSGSGPAYLAMMIEAMADAGVMQGLTRETATMLSVQTMLGTAKLMIEKDISATQLKEMVTSPGGTTMAGLYALEKNGFKGAILECIEKAAMKSKSLSR